MSEQSPENAQPPGPETCPSLCVERSHLGREHDEAEHGCYCWELCAMGPTCPAANAGLDRGCWRVKAGKEGPRDEDAEVTAARQRIAERERVRKAAAERFRGLPANQQRSMWFAVIGRIFRPGERT